MPNNWGDFVRNKNGELEKYFPLHEGQRDVLNSEARFRAAIAGSGSGKTSMGALDLVRAIHENPTGIFLMVAPSFNIMFSATLPAFQRTVEGTDLEGVYKVAKYLYELPSGGTIYCRSSDKENSFEGIQANYAWLDEGGQISRQAWEAILRRVGAKKGRILVTTTPYSFNWLYQDFLERSKEGNLDYYCRSFPSYANPTYPKEEYERARRELAPHKFAMFYNGEFVRAAGLVFGDLKSCIVDSKDVPPGRLVGGMDFGYNDPFAALAGVLDQDGCLWVLYERYVRGMAVEEHANFLPDNVTWYCDSARPDNIRTLRRLGHYAKPVKKNPGSVQRGIELVNQRIKAGKLKIVKGTVSALLEESELYRYPEKDESTSGDVPLDANNHACDALRYLIQSIDYRKAKLFVTS